MKKDSSIGEGAPEMPLGFGVRGLDPAFTFGGTRAVSKTVVKREATSVPPACEDRSTLHVQSRERKSGVKPPHSKASRHSHVALAILVALPAKATACAVCMGSDDATLRNASNSTLWVLLALVCFIFLATASTAFFLWRKAKNFND